MLRKNIHIFYGLGIGILLVVSVMIFNHYWNAQPQEPVKIYKTTVPSKRESKTVKPSTMSEVPPRAESETRDHTDVEEPRIIETEAPAEEFQSEPEEFADFSESLSITQSEELLQEDPKQILLKKVFPEFDRLLRETQELAADMKRMTSENFAAFEARGKALEVEVQGYCRRVAEEFPEAVTFIIFQDQEWAYDIDFQMLQNSLEGPVPPELKGYFRYASMREMFGLPDIPPEQLQQMQ